MLLLSQRDTKTRKFKTAYGGTVIDSVSKYSVMKHIPTGDIAPLIDASKMKKYLKKPKDYRFLEYGRQEFKTFN